MSCSRALILVGCVGLLFVTVEVALMSGQTTATIKITDVPPYDQGGLDKIAPIAGTINGVKPAECKIVLYVRTNTWYVKPYAASPYTTADQHNKRKADTHLGMEYAAILVRSSHKDPPATTATLP